MYSSRMSRNPARLPNEWINVPSGQVTALPNNGRGDCLFRAISHQMQGFMQAPALRNLAVEHLRQHRSQFYETLIGFAYELLAEREINEPDPLADDYQDLLITNALAHLERPTTMAGEESLLALSDALNVKIFVYQPEVPLITYSPQSSRNVQDLWVLRVLRVGTHFESVIQWRPNRPDVAIPAGRPLIDGSTDEAMATIRSTQLSSTETGECEEIATQTDEPLEDAPAVEMCPRPNGNASHEPVRDDPAQEICPSSDGNASSKRAALVQVPPEDETWFYPEQHEPMCFKRCTLCTARVGTYALIPCGHFPVCGICRMRWFSDTNSICPHCRQRVVDTIKVFNQSSAL